jgi:hypothetical protein
LLTLRQACLTYSAHQVLGSRGALYRYLVPALAELDLAHSLSRMTVTRNCSLKSAVCGRTLYWLRGAIARSRMWCWALANPDFIERCRSGTSLNAADPATFFGGGAKGYVDYPTLNRSAVRPDIR